MRFLLALFVLFGLALRMFLARVSCPFVGDPDLRLGWSDVAVESECLDALLLRLARGPFRVSIFLEPLLEQLCGSGRKPSPPMCSSSLFNL